MRSLPFSSEKVGYSQSDSFFTFSGVASGMMKVPGHGASLSTMRVIFTSPTLNWFIMTLLFQRQLSPNFGNSPSTARTL